MPVSDPVDTPACRSTALATQGWLIADAIGPDVVAELRDWAAQMVPPPVGPFYASTAHATREQSRAIDQGIKARLGSLLGHLAPDHEIFLAAIIAKGADDAGEVAFHQDWTYTDERDAPAVLCWIPLVDTTADSGALRAVSGSHRWTTGVRPSGVAGPTDPHQEALEARATTVALRAGQAMVYDPGLIHGSWPNTAPHERVAVAVALCPVGTQLVHFHVEGDGPLLGYRIDESYFTTEPFATAPRGAPALAPWAPAVTADDIARGLAEHPAP